MMKARRAMIGIGMKGTFKGDQDQEAEAREVGAQDIGVQEMNEDGEVVIGRLEGIETQGGMHHQNDGVEILPAEIVEYM